MTTANVTVAGDFRHIGPTGEGGKLGHEASMGIGPIDLVLQIFDVFFMLIIFQYFKI